MVTVIKKNYIEKKNGIHIQRNRTVLVFCKCSCSIKFKSGKV